MIFVTACVSNVYRYVVLTYSAPPFLTSLQMLINNNQQAMAPLLRELRRLLQLRLQDSRDTIGYNLAACRMIGRVAQEHKASKMLGMAPETTNVWAGLGLGSDVAAALEGSSKKKR